jgi:hypothetical protein
VLVAATLFYTEKSMRKKSHLLLANYLVHDIQTEQLVLHKKAFCLGSILPDCKPSFLTTKHEFSETFAMVQNKIEALSKEEKYFGTNQRAYVRQVGEVIHYIADYFTFPHNDTYTGNLKDHCFYEKDLKIGLRKYIKSGQDCIDRPFIRTFHSLAELIEFIKKVHQEYISRARNVEEDCKFIVNTCRQVVQGIFQLAFSNVLYSEKEMTFLFGLA